MTLHRGFGYWPAAGGALLFVAVIAVSPRVAPGSAVRSAPEAHSAPSAQRLDRLAVVSHVRTLQGARVVSSPAHPHVSPATTHQLVTPRAPSIARATTTTREPRLSQAKPVRPSTADARMVVVQQTVRVADGQIIVLGQAVNASEVTFDRADVRVALYDASGRLLNKVAKDEVAQTAGTDIAPGNIFPYRWSQAEPAAYAQAVVKITGVDAADAQAVPPVRMTVLRRRDDGSGNTTVVTGTIESGCRQTIAITAEVAAYDSNGKLIALGSAMFGDDPMIVLDADAGSWQFTVRLDAFVEDIAQIRVFPAGSVS